MSGLIGRVAEGGGGIYTPTIIDYLRPDVARPDIYEDESFVVKDIRGPTPSDDHDDHTLKSLAYTVMVIILSAALFILAVAWADVLRSWFDSHDIDAVIQKQLYSRIKYASCITVIAIVIILLCLFFWNSFLRF